MRYWPYHCGGTFIADGWPRGWGKIQGDDVCDRYPAAIGHLTIAPIDGPFCWMATPTEENFNDYKRAEKKALEILAAMKAVTPKKVDIELALLVAIFELHKGSLPPETITSVIQGHLKQLLPYYVSKAAPTNPAN